jgi:hypothetical protein
LDPLASLGLLVFLLILGPLEDFMVGDLELFGPLVDLRSLAMTLAQRIAKMRKRILREFILFWFLELTSSWTINEIYEAD